MANKLKKRLRSQKRLSAIRNVETLEPRLVLAADYPDLEVTKTDNQTTAIPGTAIEYTIVVRNVGQRDVVGAKIQDLTPADITDVSWTATYSAGSSGPASATGNLVGIVEDIDLLAGGTATFILTGTIAPDATGTLSNTVTVAVDSEFPDSDPSNNEATDTTTLIPTGDLSITKTDGLDIVAGGDRVTYTITLANTGPSDAVGATFTDELSSDIVSALWTAVYSAGSSGPASGSGSIDANEITLRAGGTATFTITASIAASATGAVLNTATITPPAGFDDPNLDNNLASDSTAVENEVDLQATITDGREAYLAGSDAVYTVIVTNRGPGAAVNARIVATLPQGVPTATWTASYSPGSLGESAGSSVGADGIDTTVTLLPGGAVIYTLRGPMDAEAVDFQTVTVDVTASDDNVEDNLFDNVASDTNYRPLIAVGTDIDCESVPTVTILDAQTGSIVSQFLAFEPGFRGGVRTAMTDVDGDGVPEVIAASGLGRIGEVRVFDLFGAERPGLRMQPYGTSFLGGVSIATDDIDGDGIGELITGQSRGSGRVQVFRGLAGAPGWEATPYRVFDPYGSSHVNGVSVAAADVGTFSNGATIDALSADGRREVAVTSGPGVVKPARVFDVSGTPTVIRELTGEPLGTTGGATISAGRYDSDGLEDLLIAGGSDSGSITAVYSGRTDLASAQLLQRYAAFADIAGSSPVFSTGVDINGDGRIDEIFSFQGAGGTGGTRVFDPAGNLTEVVTVLRGPLERGAQAHLTGSASYGPQAIPLVTTASGLQYRDLVVGAGAPAVAGQTVSVHYVGSRQNGELFDSSRTRGTPFTFTLGNGQVIAGWDEGVAGMRVGGRRTLIIPANLAYGNTPPGSIIQPGDTLVFDVELLSAS